MPQIKKPMVKQPSNNTSKEKVEVASKVSKPTLPENNSISINESTKMTV